MTLVKRSIEKLFQLSRRLEIKWKKKDHILENVYSTFHDKNVLICYITTPFTNGTKLDHSNYVECITAAETFRDLNYNVDVINLYSNYPVDYSKYQVVYGNGTALENAFFADNAEQIFKILYSPGTNPYYFYTVNSNLLFKTFQEKGVWLSQSYRMNNQFWPIQFVCSDLVIALGNSFVEKTFKSQNPDLNSTHLHGFFYDGNKTDPKDKDFSSAKKNFVWFGSGGAMYKGLGLLIDYFSMNPGINLHICGLHPAERKFLSLYSGLIEKSPNIKNHGFININSVDFYNLMLSSAFVIFPSSSEGGAVATINVMANGGLIPIISKATGLDVEDHGFVMDDININTLDLYIKRVLSFDDNKLRQLAEQTFRTVRANYTLANYQHNLKLILTKTLGNG